MQDLKELIERQYVTVHRFCRRHQQLNRSTVYQVLRGNYPGNIEKQRERIMAALNGEDQELRVYEALKAVSCGRCSVTGSCDRCKALFQEQTKAVLQAI
jgi:hypothetical protein